MCWLILAPIDIIHTENRLRAFRKPLVARPAPTAHESAQQSAATPKPQYTTLNIWLHSLWSTLGFCEKKRRKKRISTSFFLGDTVLGNCFSPNSSSDYVGERFNAFHSPNGVPIHVYCIFMCSLRVGAAGIDCLVLEMFSFSTPRFSCFRQMGSVTKHDQACVQYISPRDFPHGTSL